MVSRLGLGREGIDFFCHHVVIRRKDNHVVGELFPDGPLGAVQAAREAHRRNKDPNSSYPPYFPDHLRPQELYYVDGDANPRRHVHNE